MALSEFIQENKEAIANDWVSKLVSDLIDVVRARLGKGIPIDTKPMDMRTVVEQAVNEAKAAHPDRNISTEPTGDLRGDWDSLRMAQVLSNLLGNAIQHGGKTSAIGIIAKGTPQEIQLSVHNDGAAIPTAVIATIFEPMTRGKGKKQQESASMSLGLGLFIAKEIVEAHGGKINVSSSEAEGTTFSVRLPRIPSKASDDLGCSESAAQQPPRSRLDSGTLPTPVRTETNILCSDFEHHIFEICRFHVRRNEVKPHGEERENIRMKIRRYD